MQQNNGLQTVCGFSFPSSSLLTVQLMKELSDPNKSNNKPGHFFFVNLVGSSKGDGGNRTYDFQNNLISQKFSINELGGLVFALRQYAIGNSQAVYPYSKFSRGGDGSTKILNMFEGSDQQNIGGNQVNVRKIILYSNDQSNGRKVSLSMTPADAHALCEALRKLHEKSLDLEIERQAEMPHPNPGGNNMGNNQGVDIGNNMGQNNPNSQQNNMGGGAPPPEGNPFDAGVDNFGMNGQNQGNNNGGNPNDVMHDVNNQFQNFLNQQ